MDLHSLATTRQEGTAPGELFYLGRNVSPVSRMPAEILGMIFCYVPPSDASDSDGSESGDEDQPAEEDCAKEGGVGEDAMPSWVSVTQVCRRWRWVAFGWGRFWLAVGPLPLQSRRWTRYAVTHSFPFPIDIRVTLDVIYSYVLDHATVAAAYMKGSSLDIALGDLSRVRAIELGAQDELLDDDSEMPSAHVDFVLSRMRLYEAPKLETFSILCGPPFGPIDIPGDLFKGKTPSNLRKVIFKSCKIGLDSNIFASPTLETLAISRCVNNIFHSWNEFMCVLHYKLSSLKVLQLGYCVLPRGGVEDNHIGDHGRVLRMPSLELLDISDEPTKIVELLSCVLLPPRCHLRFTLMVNGDNMGTRDSDALAAALASYCAAQGRIQPFSKVIIEYAERRSSFGTMCTLLPTDPLAQEGMLQLRILNNPDSKINDPDSELAFMIHVLNRLPFLHGAVHEFSVNYFLFGYQVLWRRAAMVNCLDADGKDNRWNSFLAYWRNQEPNASSLGQLANWMHQSLRASFLPDGPETGALMWQAENVKGLET